MLLLVWTLRAFSAGPVHAQLAADSPAVPGASVAEAETCSSAPASRVQGLRSDVVDFRLDDYRSVDGHLWLNGTVRNNCSQAQLISVAAIVRAGQAATSEPVAISTTRHLDVEANGVADFLVSLTGDLPEPVFWMSFRLNAVPAGTSSGLVCLELDSTRCLPVSPHLAGSIEELATLEEGAQLLRAAADRGLSIRGGSSVPAFWGTYDRPTRRITLSWKLDSLSLWERAAVIAHELHYALDVEADATALSADTCLARRMVAFRRQGEVWNAFWQQHPPPPASALQRVLSRAAHGEWQDPAALLGELSSTFAHPCS